MKQRQLEIPFAGRDAPGSSTSERSALARCLREPLLHFAVLGALIFTVGAWRGHERLEEDASTHIEVTAGTISWLREGFAKQWNREPDADELRGLVNDHLREEILYREALAMGLDRDDSIVRRRMAQKMEFLTQDIAAAVEPNDEALRKFFDENAAHYAKAERVSFRHVFFSKERRGEKLDADARDALTTLVKGASDETLGDPFLGGFEFTDASADDIAAVIGREFAEKVALIPTGEWNGPVASSYGEHLVRVGGRAEPQAVTFESVRDAVIRDFSEDRRRAANQEFLERLKARYRITVDESAISVASAPSTKTATR